MSQVSKEDVAEYRIFVKRSREIAAQVTSGHVLDHPEFDAIIPMMRFIRWKKGSRGERLTELLRQIGEGYSAGNGSPEFSPQNILALLDTIEERILLDLAPSKKKK